MNIEGKNMFIIATIAKTRKKDRARQNRGYSLGQLHKPFP